MANVIRRIGLSLGADICWPIAYEQIMRRLDLKIPIDGDEVGFEVDRVTIEPFDLRQPCPYDLVIDRVNSNASFQMGYMTMSMPYPYWPKATAPNVSADSPVTSELDAIPFTWTSSITIADPLPEGIHLVVQDEIGDVDPNGRCQHLGGELHGGDVERIPVSESGRIRLHHLDGTSNGVGHVHHVQLRVGL